MIDIKDNSTDSFDEWWADNHLDFNHRDILRACELAFNAGRASLSANEQDKLDAERYRYIKERVYSDMESWTLPEIEEQKDYKYSIKVSRFDYAVDKAITNKAKDGE